MSPIAETASGPIWHARTRRPVTGRPPVVLIHGAGGSHLHWPPYLRRLPGTDVLALDLPGHGRSAGAGRDSIANYAADLLAWLDALAVERAVLCGHSMGGAVAQWLALERPERVAGLVLMGTGAMLRVAPILLETVLNNPAAVLGMMADWLYGPAAPPALRELGMQAMAAVPPAVFHGDLLACDQFDVRGRLAEICVPTLVVGATEDKMTPLKFSHYLAENIPGAQLVIVAEAGHMMMLERPDEVGAAVTRFLSAL